MFYKELGKLKWKLSKCPQMIKFQKIKNINFFDWVLVHQIINRITSLYPINMYNYINVN